MIRCGALIRQVRKLWTLGIMSDTGPLLALGVFDRLDLLSKLYGPVYVPTAVRSELEVGAPRYADARNALRAVSGGFIKVVSVKEALASEVQDLVKGPPRLGRAQAESVLICRQLNIDALLADDQDVIKVA